MNQPTKKNEYYKQKQKRGMEIGRENNLRTINTEIRIGGSILFWCNFLGIVTLGSTHIIFSLDYICMYVYRL